MKKSNYLDDVIEFKFGILDLILLGSGVLLMSLSLLFWLRGTLTLEQFYYNLIVASCLCMSYFIEKYIQITLIFIFAATLILSIKSYDITLFDTPISMLWETFNLITTNYLLLIVFGALLGIYISMVVYYEQFIFRYVFPVSCLFCSLSSMIYLQVVFKSEIILDIEMKDIISVIVQLFLAQIPGFIAAYGGLSFISYLLHRGRINQPNRGT